MDKAGPYKGSGSIGKKTSDATRKSMGYLEKGGQQISVDYDSHQKALASHDAKVLKRNRVPSSRQN